jgi:hypothetical protein
MFSPVCSRSEQLPSAKPVAVYDALMDFECWPDWMPTVSAAAWERPGGARNRSGGIRRVRVGPCVTHDRIGLTRPLVDAIVLGDRRVAI